MFDESARPSSTGDTSLSQPHLAVIFLIALLFIYALPLQAATVVPHIPTQFDSIHHSFMKVATFILDVFEVTAGVNCITDHNCQPEPPHPWIR